MKRVLHAGLAAALALVLAAADPAIAAERGRTRERDRDRDRDRERAAEKLPDSPLKVRQVEGLAFGRVTVRKEMGFVTIDPGTGAKRVRGAGDLGGQHAVGEFMVRGEPGRRFRITLPEVVPVQGREMRRARLQDFRSEPAEAGRLGPDGKAVVRVGATLRLPADARGKFEQPFEIFVDYED